MESFNISVEGFSGPLDLLCSMVEDRTFEAANIKVSQLIRVYGVYLARTQNASVETLAEFFYMVAGLLLEKTRSLLPRSGGLDEPITEEELEAVDEDEIMETLERYRPYRSAYLWLYDRLEQESRSFRRIPDEGAANIPPSELEYDLCDLYFLCRVWWGLYERYEQARNLRLAQMEAEDAADWDGLLDEPLPDEEHVNTRITELEAQLAEEGELSLNGLCRAERSSFRGIKGLVVTLLALLEMCRMGKIIIEQEALFADVKILANPTGASPSGADPTGTTGTAVA